MRWAINAKPCAINIVTRNIHKKYVKQMLINDRKIEAIIDTGNDICVMRAD